MKSITKKLDAPSGATLSWKAWLEDNAADAEEQ